MVARLSKGAPRWSRAGSTSPSEAEFPGGSEAERASDEMIGAARVLRFQNLKWFDGFRLLAFIFTLDCIERIDLPIKERFSGFQLLFSFYIHF